MAMASCRKDKMPEYNSKRYVAQATTSSSSEVSFGPILYFFFRCMDYGQERTGYALNECDECIVTAWDRIRQ